MRDPMSGNSRSAQIDVSVIVCSFGRNDLTLQTLEDLDLANSRGGHAVCIVDNQGSFVRPAHDTVHVIRPPSNLGWARGSNRGVRSMMSRTDAQVFVLLNNDVRLSYAFVQGLYEAWQQTGAAVIGPAYDHNWPQQRIAFNGRPSDYLPMPVDRLVPFVDGTCMLISRKIVDAIGFLDDQHWAEWGWGCDKDFCLRARATGASVFVTERSYLSHTARGTAALMPDFSEANAEAENDEGMTVKWGTNWRDLLYEGFDSCSRVGLVQERLSDEDSGS